MLLSCLPTQFSNMLYLLKAAGLSVVATDLLGLRITVICVVHIAHFPLCTTPCGRFVHGSKWLPTKFNSIVLHYNMSVQTLPYMCIPRAVRHTLSKHNENKTEYLVSKIEAMNLLLEQFQLQLTALLEYFNLRGNF